MENQEPEKSSTEDFTAPPASDQVITSTVKETKPKKTQEELQLEKNLLSITEKQEKRRSEARAIARRKIKKFQMLSTGKKHQEVHFH